MPTPIVPIYTLDTMSAEDKKRILTRAQGEIEGIYPQVAAIIKTVRERGDDALIEYMRDIDGVALTVETLRVTPAEIQAAYAAITPKLLAALKTLYSQVQRFHDAQKPKEWVMEVSPGLMAGQIMIPLESAGCYIPAGRGWFPSTVFMNACPAKAAGVQRIALCIPPEKDGTINPGSLVAADIAGVTEIYKLSGAQAVAAMAYGTATIKPTQTITGPGGAWVVAAKHLVKNDVAIGVEAGPSEGFVIADSAANAKYVATDIIIQTEHGNDSAGVCVTDSLELAQQVQAYVDQFTAELPDYRQEFVKNSMRKYGAIVVTKTMDEAFAFANDYGPEHLEIQTANPFQDMKKVQNAGGLYLGAYAPLAAGCYCSGPNHTLPTAKAGRTRGGLNTEDYLKKVTYEYPTKEGLAYLKDAMVELANYETFAAHRNSILKRFED